MYKESRNGYEVSIALQYTDKTRYRWVLIRYPLDVHNNEEIEVLAVLDLRDHGVWQDILNRHIADNPDDGLNIDYPKAVLNSAYGIAAGAPVYNDSESLKEED